MRGQGRVFLRNGIWWIAYYHRGKEIRESSESEEKAVAAKRLIGRLRTAGTAGFVGPAAERLTFEDLAKLFVTDYTINGRRSLADAKRSVKKLRGFFGPDRAIDITADRIDAYKQHRLGERTRLGGQPRPATINRELASLRRMFSLAVRAAKLPNRPHVALLAESNVREGFLEPEEFEAVRAALRSDLVDVASFAYLTGWRIGAIRALEWRDVKLERQGDRITGGTVRLRAEASKNKRPYQVVLGGELLEVIVRRQEARRLDCPFVFHGNGKPVGDFRRAWCRACKLAGFAGRTFHDLRRSAVRNMVRAGVPERVAMTISGHRTRSVFDRYNVVSEQDLAEATERTLRYVVERRTREVSVVPICTAAGKTRTKHGQSEGSGERRHRVST